MTIKELIEKLSEEKPGTLAGIPPKKATALVRAVFTEINRAVAETADGTVTIVGLGHFRVKQVKREADGQSIDRKQVIFRPAKEKSGKNTGGNSENVEPGAGE